MKNLLLFGICFLFSLTLHSQVTVSGSIKYKNDNFVFPGYTIPTPMNNCIVYLIAEDDTIAQTITDINGAYVFDTVIPGYYSIKVHTNKVFSGIAATDALLILEHFVGMITLTGLNLDAAEINSDGYVNCIDALLIIRRFTGAIYSFMPPNVYPGTPDWVFDAVNFEVTNLPVTANIRALCTGDVNGSYLLSYP